MATRFRATFLTGERVYIRGMVLDDKDRAMAWCGGPFPINATKAEGDLKGNHQGWDSKEQQYAIVRTDGDEVVGGVTIWTDRRVAELSFNMAPTLAEADELRAEALRLLVRWLRDEAEMMVTDAKIAADEPLTIAVAEELGMQRAVTFRQRLARPGSRVDQYRYQALNPNWSTGEGRHA